MAALTVYASESAVPEATGAREAVRRARVVLVHPGSGVPVVDEHLRVELPALAPWPRLADVLLGAGEGCRGAADLAARHPGALVVAVHRGHDCWIRFATGGHALTLTAQRSSARLSWAMWASLAHAWLVSGLPVVELASVPVRLLPDHSPRPSKCPSSVRAASASVERDRPAVS